LCFWPDKSLPDKDDWSHALAGLAGPVNKADWQSSNDTSSLPDWIAARLSPSPHLSCFGAENCCFDGLGRTQYPEIINWSSLIGHDAKEASAALLQDTSVSTAPLVPADATLLTMDYRHDRVRIFITRGGKVAKAPRRG